MVCTTCQRKCRKHGFNRNGTRRYRCGVCGTTYSEEREHLFGDMRVSEDVALIALKMLCEGSSVRSVARVTGLHKATVLKLLVYAGEKVERYMAATIQDVPVKDVECDETWSFIGQKERTKRKNKVRDREQGDSYLWIGLERHTKLVLCHHIGRRTNVDADAFAEKLDRATAGLSRCWRNHKAALSLWIGYYNFVKMHRSISMTPAMAADLTRRPWSMRDLLTAATQS